MLQKVLSLWRNWRERGRQRAIDRMQYRGAADDAVAHHDKGLSGPGGP